jgi:hypothetical protein
MSPRDLNECKRHELAVIVAMGVAALLTSLLLGLGVLWMAGL